MDTTTMRGTPSSDSVCKNRELTKRMSSTEYYFVDGGLRELRGATACGRKQLSDEHQESAVAEATS